MPTLVSPKISKETHKIFYPVFKKLFLLIHIAKKYKVVKKG